MWKPELRHRQACMGTGWLGNRPTSPPTQWEHAMAPDFLALVHQMGLMIAWHVAPCQPWPVAICVYRALHQPVWRTTSPKPHSGQARPQQHKRNNMPKLGNATCVQPWCWGKGHWARGHWKAGQWSLVVEMQLPWCTLTLHLYMYVGTFTSESESCHITIPNESRLGLSIGTKKSLPIIEYAITLAWCSVRRHNTYPVTI